MKQKIIVGVTGASGSVYALMLFKRLMELQNQWENVSVVVTQNAEDVWKYELPDHNLRSFPFKYYYWNDFFAPPASGSAGFDSMIIIPCSMGTLGKIASGIADNLLTRAADVMLKERKKLILVTREMPYNLVHIENMKTVTLAGGIICPASPSFYSLPQNQNDILFTVVDKTLSLCGFQFSFFQWGNKEH